MTTSYTPGPFTRLALRFASTRFGGWYFTTITPWFDRWLLSRSQGRYSLAGLGAPTLLLITVGRKTGKQRTTPLLYITDGQRLILVGSRGGHRHHAAWYLNLVAEPQVKVLKDGQQTAWLAETAEGAERARLWQQLLNINPWFQRYQDRLTREIPIIILQPHSSGAEGLIENAGASQQHDV